MLRCLSGSSNCVVCTDGTAVQLNKHAWAVARTACTCLPCTIRDFCNLCDINPTYSDWLWSITCVSEADFYSVVVICIALGLVWGFWGRGYQEEQIVEKQDTLCCLESVDRKLSYFSPFNTVNICANFWICLSFPSSQIIQSHSKIKFCYWCHEWDSFSTITEVNSQTRRTENVVMNVPS